MTFFLSRKPRKPRCAERCGDSCKLRCQTNAMTPNVGVKPHSANTVGESLADAKPSESLTASTTCWAALDDFVATYGLVTFRIIMALAVIVLGLAVIDWKQETDQRLQVLEQPAVATQGTQR
jgi:hypothetical protein